MLVECLPGMFTCCNRGHLRLQRSRPARLTTPQERSRMTMTVDAQTKFQEADDAAYVSGSRPLVSYMLMAPTPYLETRFRTFEWYICGFRRSFSQFERFQSEDCVHLPAMIFSHEYGCHTQSKGNHHDPLSLGYRSASFRDDFWNAYHLMDIILQMLFSRPVSNRFW